MNTANISIPCSALNRSNASGVEAMGKAVEMKSFPVTVYLKSMPVFGARARRYEDGTYRLGSEGAMFSRKLTQHEIERVACRYEAVLLAEVFVDCEFGGAWKKINAITAECVEADSGFIVGERIYFSGDHEVSIEAAGFAA